MLDDTSSDRFSEDRHSHRSKAERRAARRAERSTGKNTLPPAPRANPLLPLNDVQAEYIDALQECSQVFAIGEAGTGKTYVAARHAVGRLLEGKTTGITIARPAISKAKHKQGFLPGTAAEKIAPWLEPVLGGLRDGSSSAAVEKFLKDGKIDYLAFEFMRGRTINGRIVILDEAQNCDLDDLRMFLTRIGEDTQVIICGDPTQVDIPNSGLETVLDMIEDYDIPAAVIEFGPEHVVRSEVAKVWVQAFKRERQTG